VFDGKINGEIRRRSAAAFVLALKQSAVYEDAALFGTPRQGQLMARAGYAGSGAVMGNIDHSDILVGVGFQAGNGFTRYLWYPQ
jgi:hypothetical protein